MSDLIKSLPEFPALLAAFVFAFLSAVLLILKIMKEYHGLVDVAADGGTARGNTRSTVVIAIVVLAAFFLFLFAQTRALTRESELITENTKIQDQILAKEERETELNAELSDVQTDLEALRSLQTQAESVIVGLEQQVDRESSYNRELLAQFEDVRAQLAAVENRAIIPNDLMRIDPVRPAELFNERLRLDQELIEYRQFNNQLAQ